MEEWTKPWFVVLGGVDYVADVEKLLVDVASELLWVVEPFVEKTTEVVKTRFVIVGVEFLVDVFSEPPWVVELFVEETPKVVEIRLTAVVEIRLIVADVGELLVGDVSGLLWVTKLRIPIEETPVTIAKSNLWQLDNRVLENHSGRRHA